ncbi:uncharacterized protein LOC111893731 [Lactuca sativa]|uniref:uncharacterized protein LOC111893731 n=1 Tax=Lactuca sativa TaxID=4236 RepID=UPI000CD8EF88|nr:uncharacterized protein LOC111893731 [Lactuca sativa]
MNVFLNDDDQGKGCGAEVDVNDTTFEDQNDKNDAQGKVDGRDGPECDDDDKNDDVVGKGNFSNEDVNQGNTSGFNEEDVINLNSIVGNVVKSVGLVDGFEGDVNDIQEGISFRQFMYENLVGCGINQKAAEDDMNDILTRTLNLGYDDTNKEGISDDTVNKVIGEKNKDDESIAPSLVKGCVGGEGLNDKAKKDGQGVVECEVGTDFENRVEDDSNKNLDHGVETISLGDQNKNENQIVEDSSVKDGKESNKEEKKVVGEETTKEGDELNKDQKIIEWKDSNETKSLIKDKAEGKFEKFSGPSFSLGFSQDSQGFKNPS